MPRFTVNEPHPTVAKDSFTHSGRGGAGNFFRAPETTPSTGISTAPVTTAPRPSPGRFYSGRGGAGNAHASAQRPVMSIEESYRLQSHIEAKAVGYVGRGGAGNAFVKGVPASASQRKGSDASSVASSRSSGSVRSNNLLERISSSLRRNS
ncbi:hypothetical protein PG990_010991 [Apiospora arundinis]|uniref:Uncharacterized protein n=1 Tax=Apiospora arundinis TaxID=335852 RepID=A0ABR2JH46_9PEZI